MTIFFLVFFYRNNILTYFDDSRYKRKSYEIMKWRTMGAHSIAKKENLIETKKNGSMFKK